MSLLSQIVVGLLLVLLVIVLFFDEQDYLSFSVLFVFIASLVSAIDVEEARDLSNYITAIDWEVIFFLIAMFTIIEILNEAKVFHQIAQLIVNKFHTNIRLMFYVICVISTLTATIIEDLSVAIIFIPVIIISCRKLNINPAPFLLGMTICINLAATLTPFGSAQNLMIANFFDLSALYFVTNFGVFFIVATAVTLVLLDLLVLRKSLKDNPPAQCEDPEKVAPVSIEEFEVDPKVFWKNIIALGVFMVLLLTIHDIHVAGILGMLIFIFINMERGSRGGWHPKLSSYLRKVDYKLIYFFICLYVFVFLMDKNGTILLLEGLIERVSITNTFWLAVLILILTSLLSGLIDNAPVTIMFLPIIDILTDNPNVELLPLMIAFVLGINLGGNFLPQGSAADMMTLELAQKNCVPGLTYKRLTKVGGLFALLHVALGILYLAIVVLIF